MQTRYQYLLRFILLVTDIFLLNLAFLTTNHFIQITSIEGDGLFKHYLITCNLLWLFSANVFGMYNQQTVERVEMIYRATWKSIMFHSTLFIVYLAYAKDADYSREFLVYFYMVLCACFLFSRFLGTIIETILIRSFKIRKPVAILGVNSTSSKLASYFRNNKNNFLFKGFLKDTEEVTIDQNGEMVPASCDEIRRAADMGIKEVYVSMTPQRLNEAPHLIMEAEKQCIRLKFVPDLTGSLPAPFSVNYLGGFPVVNLRHEPLEDMKNRFKKRIFDIIFSLLAIIFIMSWLTPIMAIIIKLQSPGPVFFKQERSGRNNDSFWCLKFRSMRINSDSDSRQATKDDDRITPIGRFMRRTSIDEFPQFFNVFAGSMSIVGPRPHMLTHTREYSELISQFMVRHFLKPGITGWAQVNGYRGETREREEMEARVEHDIWYMENWSSMLDVKIIFLTIINMIKGEENAY
jgi:Undecaprenyl-phosphate glucose phosphotransferase